METVIIVAVIAGAPIAGYLLYLLGCGHGTRRCARLLAKGYIADNHDPAALEQSIEIFADYLTVVASDSSTPDPDVLWMYRLAKDLKVLVGRSRAYGRIEDTSRRAP